MTVVNTGTLPNDGTGDALRTAFLAINQQFLQVQGLDFLNAKYLGSQATDPTQRIDATALVVGDFYLNSADTAFRFWDGTAWVQGATLEAVNQLYLDTLAARDAALVGAGVYATEAAGRAAVADGVAFKVQGSGDVAAYEYRRTNSTTSVLIATYPSKTLVANVSGNLVAALNSLTPSETVNFTGTSGMYPLVTDSANKTILGIDSATGAVSALGLAREGDTGLMGLMSQADYTGSGPVYPFFTDVSGKVILGYDISTGLLTGSGFSVAAVPVAKAVNHLLFYGQSLSVGAQGTPILSTTQPYNNITFNGGPRAWTGSANDFSAFKPLVEDAVNPAPDGSAGRGETPCSGAANYASTLASVENGIAPANHVILASTAGHGGYRINQLTKGTAWYAKLILHISSAKALNTNYALHAVAWMQGENDAVTGTQTPYATYRAALAQLQFDMEADAIAISGQTSGVYCLTYQMSYGARTWPDQAKAQLDLAQKNAKFALVTPMYHFPYAVDNVHLTAVGYKWCGAYFGRAYKKLVIDGVKPPWLNPVSATCRGPVVRVRFSVPTLPMVLDTTTLAVTTNHGFKVLDGASAATISGIAVDGSDLVITLSTTPSGVVTVRGGLDYVGAGLTMTGGASTNLRDSTPDTITVDGVARPLYHVCPHFEMTVTKLGD